MSEEETIFRNLFSNYDQNNNGKLDRNEWSELCAGMDIPDDQSESIFNILSEDKAVITLDDFLNGFTSTINSKDLKRIRFKSRSSFGEVSNKTESLSSLLQQCNTNDIIDRMLELEKDADLSLGNGQIHELHRILQYQYPHLVPAFKEILKELIIEIRYKASDLKTCEMKLENERKLNEQKMRELERELESQLLLLEEKARKEEQERVRSEYEKKLQINQKELEEIKERYDDLQQVGAASNWDPTTDHQPQNSRNETSEQLKERITLLQKENKELSETVGNLNENVEIIKKEMRKIKEEMDIKSEEENQTKQLWSEYLREHEKNSEQLRILSQQNNLLQDHNENLRIKLDSSNSHSFASNFEFSPDSNGIAFLKDDEGELMEDYSSKRFHRVPNSDLYRLGDGRSSEDAESVCSNEGLATSQYLHDWKEVHEKLNDLHQENSLYTQNAEPITRPRTLKKILPNPEQRWSINEDVNNLYKEEETSPRRTDGRQQFSWSVPEHSIGTAASSMSTLDPLTTIDTPERMYKVVLAGDSGVGKSSYMNQLCRKEFHNNMTATLGVDFQTKTLDVEGKLYAIQLWDTAGQERFRSICKSYFRRADGVIVMFDCTNEKSFLNVRSWIDTIRNETNGDIPILLIGNKTDLRESKRTMGCRVVEWVDGWRLADGENFLFIETSVKDNFNIEDAMIQLAKALKTKEDYDVTNIRIGMNLKTSGFQRALSCCGRN